MSYLTCPNCRFTVSRAAARSPFQNCPRCQLRDGAQTMMVIADPPRRFERRPINLERIAEAKARLTRQHRGVGSV